MIKFTMTDEVSILIKADKFRAYPNSSLGEPIHKIEDVFFVEDVVKKHFFPNL